MWRRYELDKNIQEVWMEVREEGKPQEPRGSGTQVSLRCCAPQSHTPCPLAFLWDSAQFLWGWDNNKPTLNFITKKADPSSLPPALPRLCMQTSLLQFSCLNLSLLSVPCIISALELQEISEKPFRDRL